MAASEHIRHHLSKKTIQMDYDMTNSETIWQHMTAFLHFNSPPVPKGPSIIFKFDSLDRLFTKNAYMKKKNRLWYYMTNYDTIWQHMTAFCSSVASSIIFKCDSHDRRNKADFVHTRCLVLQKNLNKKPKTKKIMAQNEIIKQNEMKQSGKQRNNKTTEQRKLPKKWVPKMLTTSDESVGSVENFHKLFEKCSKWFTLINLVCPGMWVCARVCVSVSVCVYCGLACVLFGQRISDSFSFWQFN